MSYIKFFSKFLHSKKNKVCPEPTKKGSIDVKSFQMSSNVERNNKNSTEPKKVSSPRYNLGTLSKKPF